jgi:predicted transcriptional regulator
MQPQTQELYKAWSDSIEFSKKIVNYSFKPFLAGMVLSTLLTVTAVYQHLKNCYNFSHAPEIIELQKIERLHGKSAVEKEIKENKWDYKAIAEDYQIKERQVRKYLQASFGLGLTSILIPLSVISVSNTNIQRKRKKLEEALANENP